MPYIPSRHEKYNLLPYCSKSGGEVFAYPSYAHLKVDSDLIPYGYQSYEQYDAEIDSIIQQLETDLEELAKHLYPTDASLWEIAEDPTGMAFQTIYGGRNAWSLEEIEAMKKQVVDSQAPKTIVASTEISAKTETAASDRDNGSDMP